MSNTKQLSDSERASAWRESISEEEDKRLQIKHGHWHHDIGINRDEVIQMWIDEGRPDPIVEEVSISISETKQPPKELVEKYKVYLLGIESLVTEDCPEAEQCAQIAVQHAEEIQKAKDHELSIERYKTQIMNEAYEKAKEENQELKELIEAIHLTPAFEKANEIYGHMENHWTNKIKQLLNKNEDGKSKFNSRNRFIKRA